MLALSILQVSLLNPVPSASLGRTVGLTAPSRNAVINEAGYFYRELTGSAGHTLVSVAGTGAQLSYTDLSGDNLYVMTSYTHLIDNDTYLYPFVTGFLSSSDWW